MGNIFDIRISRHQYSFEQLLKWHGKDYLCDRDAIWKSRVIESLLFYIPLGMFVADETGGNGIINIIDGRERVAAVKDFKNGKFVLEGLEILVEYNGLDATSFDIPKWRKIHECIVDVYMIERPPPGEVMDMIVSRLVNHDRYVELYLK